MAKEKLNPPLIANKLNAQAGDNIVIPFTMNKSVGLAQVDNLVILVKTVSTGAEVGTYTCNKGSLYFKDNYYYATFEGIGQYLQIGQHYKVQMAYCSTDNTVGFYSSVATFKYTAQPEVNIEGLEDGNIFNIHRYNYTGHYSNENDPAEKVYSYEFKIYNEFDEVITSSGILIHNSNKDVEVDKSQDTWSISHTLKDDSIYTIQYIVHTLNGLTAESYKYKIIDNQTVESNLSKYYDFVATAIIESGCVELSLKPKTDILNNDKKYVNGHFILLRASNEDNYNSWYRLTDFTLASWDSSMDKFLCRDYSIAQGATYKYALQAYNTRGIHSRRFEANDIFVDFEDMFLSDGKRQLCLKYNPKVSSFKNTILESKMDTIGGRYPFFFRNGNVHYKEFPISGLISLMMDENKDFLEGMNIIDNINHEDPYGVVENAIFLTGENFFKEREFKNKVLEWLTNGEPKLFRSPGEGNFIVRLMNTSLTPNDTLSRMIHSFSCTAYEVEEYTFDNLRKYGMIMDNSIEVRELEYKQTILKDAPGGKVEALEAYAASITGPDGTTFQYRLQNDVEDKTASIGPSGIYEFDRKLLKNNPLMMLKPMLDLASYWKDSVLTYAIYPTAQANEFSVIADVTIENKIETWYGKNRDEIANHIDEKGYRISIGTFKQLRVMRRPVQGQGGASLIQQVRDRGDGTYDFILTTGKNYIPKAQDIVYFNGQYYDGGTRRKIGSTLDYTLSFSKNNAPIGEKYFKVGNTPRVFADLSGVTYLYLGNGLYAEVVYLKETRLFTVEETGTIANLRRKWENSGSAIDYASYYNALCKALEDLQGGLIVDV